MSSAELHHRRPDDPVAITNRLCRLSRNHIFILQACLCPASNVLWGVTEAKHRLEAANGVLSTRIQELEDALSALAEREQQRVQQAESESMIEEHQPPDSFLALRARHDGPATDSADSEVRGGSPGRDTASDSEGAGPVQADNGELQRCQAACAVLGGLCAHVAAELAAAVGAHEGWVRSCEAAARAAADSNALVDPRGDTGPGRGARGAARGGGSQAATGSTFQWGAGANTPRRSRSTGDSILNHTLLNSSVPFATPVSTAQSNRTQPCRACDTDQGAGLGWAGWVEQVSHVPGESDPSGSATPGTPDVDQAEWQRAIRQVRPATPYYRHTAAIRVRQINPPVNAPPGPLAIPASPPPQIPPEPAPGSRSHRHPVQASPERYPGSSVFTVTVCVTICALCGGGGGGGGAVGRRGGGRAVRGGGSGNCGGLCAGEQALLDGARHRPGRRPVPPPGIDPPRRPLLQLPPQQACTRLWPSSSPIRVTGLGCRHAGGTSLHPRLASCPASAAP
jgi:hypothetical protein